MKPYRFQLGTEPWPAEVTTQLQVYAPVDLGLNPELAGLIGRWRAAVAEDPIRLVEDAALHVTLDAITDATGEAISAEDRVRLGRSLADALTDTPAYTGRAGSALAYASGVIIDISPAAPLVALHRTIRQAIHAVRGSESTAFPVGKPHISLGYAVAEADSDPVARRLRQIDPNGAPFRLPVVDLVEVSIDQDRGHLSWSTIERITLPSPDVTESAR